MMKSLIIALCLVVVAVSAAPAAPAELVRYQYDPYDNERGIYSFGFAQSDGTRHDQRGELRNQGSENEALSVTGTYSWVAPNGVVYIVKYVADENGYNSDLEEQPPGAPLEIANALLG